MIVMLPALVKSIHCSHLLQSAAKSRFTSTISTSIDSISFIPIKGTKFIFTNNTSKFKNPVLKFKISALVSTTSRSISSSPYLFCNPRKPSYWKNDSETDAAVESRLNQILEDHRKFIELGESPTSPVKSGGASATKEPNKALPSLEEMKAHRKATIAKLVEQNVPLSQSEAAVSMFNALMFKFLQKRSVEDIVIMWDLMKSHDLNPNRSSFHILLQAYSIKPRMSEFQSVFERMKVEVGLDVQAFQLLIVTYAADGRLCAWPQLFEIMQSHSVQPDLNTCNLILRDYSLALPGTDHIARAAMQLWDYMKSNNIYPDDQTVNFAIKAFHTNTQYAIQLFEEALELASFDKLSRKPDFVRLKAVLDVHARAKAYTEGMDFLSKWQHDYFPGVKLSHLIHGALFNLRVGCLRIPLAFEELEKYLNGHDRIPTDTCKSVLESLATLPESTLPEHEVQIKHWRELLRGTGEFLSDAEEGAWRIAIVRWRKLYIPKSTTPPTEKQKT